MKSDPRRFAPLGLVLSGLGFMAALGVLIIRGFAAAGLSIHRQTPNCSTEFLSLRLLSSLLALLSMPYSIPNGYVKS